MQKDTIFPNYLPAIEIIFYFSTRKVLLPDSKKLPPKYISVRERTRGLFIGHQGVPIELRGVATRETSTAMPTVPSHRERELVFIYGFGELAQLYYPTEVNEALPTLPRGDAPHVRPMGCPDDHRLQALYKGPHAGIDESHRPIPAEP